MTELQIGPENIASYKEYYLKEKILALASA
jgi:hypothetical protein